MIAWAPDPEVPDAYPIVTYTWLICYKKYPTRRSCRRCRTCVKYGLTEGQKDAESARLHPAARRLSSRKPTARFRILTAQ